MKFYRTLTILSVFVRYAVAACPINHYCPAGSTTPIPCPSGSTSTGGATRADQCICGLGLYMSSSSTCVTCPPNGVCTNNQISCFAGYYRSNTNQCLECAAGTFSRSGNNVCSPCPINYYCPRVSSGLLCPSGSTSLLGSANLSDCKCNTGTYLDGSSKQCVACPPNAVCSNNIVSCTQGFLQIGLTCSACPSGTTTSAIGGTVCITCPQNQYCANGDTRNCPSGSTSPAGSTRIQDCICTTGWLNTGSSICSNCPLNAVCSNNIITCNANYYTFGFTCAQCGAGTFSNAGSTSCSPCLAGTFNPTAGSSCSPCQAGTISAAGARACSPCAAGTSSTTGASTCTACSAGTFNPTAGGTCSLCPAGTFSGSGATSCSVCSQNFYCLAGAVNPTPCQANSRTVSTGSTSASACICNNGFYLSGGQCLQCPAGATCSNNIFACNVGYYKSGAATCTACLPGTFTSQPGLSACSSCLPGQFASSIASTECKSCPSGKFTSATGSSGCQDCIAGTFASNTGSTSCATCPIGSISGPSSSTCTTCALGKFSVDGVTCLNCAAGTDSFNGICHFCPAGQTSTSGGRCFSCPDGQYLPSGSVTCQPCPAGSYCSGSTITACPQFRTSVVGAKLLSDCTCISGYIWDEASATCILCPQNADCVGGIVCRAGYIKVVQDRVTSCAACGPGSFSTGGTTTCTLCSPGTFSSSTVGLMCTDCSAGTFSASTGAITCSDCPANSYCRAKCTSPVPCPSPATSPSRSQDVNSCNCGANMQLSLDTGGARCISTLVCAAGKYFSDSTCINCPAGTFKATAGNTGLSTCITCPSGSVCREGSSDFSCDVGYTKSSATSCKICDPGTFKSSVGNEACSLCPAGSYCSGGSNLRQCPSGASSNVGSRNIFECRCANDMILSTSSNLCLPCYTGAICDGTASVTCTAGYFMDGTCKQCPVGTFKETSGNAASCLQCPQNSNCSAVGSTIFQCLPGFWRSGSACLPCSAGSFKSTLGNTQCNACAENFYCPAASSNQVACPLNSKSPASSFSLGSCKCNEGFYLNGTNCATCEAGFYCTNGLRIQCPTSSVSSPGARSTSDCKCKDGLYMSSDTCKPCAQNYFCSGGTLLPCPTNSESMAGSNSLSNCICTSGYYKVNNSCWPCSIGATCTPTKFTCNAGYYLSGSNQCTICPSGTYKSNSGNDPSCKPCPQNAECTPSSFVCIDGLYPSTDACNSCPEGQYKDPMSDSCTVCESNFYCSGSKAQCPAGSNSAAGSKFISDCKCEAGKYISNNSCVSCPSGATCEDGKVTCKAGFSSGLDCSPCPKGTFKSEPGDGDCQACPAGAFCPDGILPIVCPENSESSAGSQDMTDCECDAGFFMGSENVCIQCPEGNFCSGSLKYACPSPGTSKLGSKSLLDCKCASGFTMDGRTCISILITDPSHDSQQNSLFATQTSSDESTIVVDVERSTLMDVDSGVSATINDNGESSKTVIANETETNRSDQSKAGASSTAIIAIISGVSVAAIFVVVAGVLMYRRISTNQLNKIQAKSQEMWSSTDNLNPTVVLKNERSVYGMGPTHMMSSQPELAATEIMRHTNTQFNGSRSTLVMPKDENRTTLVMPKDENRTTLVMHTSRNPVVQQHNRGSTATVLMNPSNPNGHDRKTVIRPNNNYPVEPSYGVSPADIEMAQMPYSGTKNGNAKVNTSKPRRPK